MALGLSTDLIRRNQKWYVDLDTWLIVLMLLLLPSQRIYCWIKELIFIEITTLLIAFDTWIFLCLLLLFQFLLVLAFNPFFQVLDNNYIPLQNTYIQLTVKKSIRPWSAWILLASIEMGDRVICLSTLALSCICFNTPWQQRTTLKLDLSWIKSGISLNLDGHYRDGHEFTGGVMDMQGLRNWFTFLLHHLLDLICTVSRSWMVS